MHPAATLARTFIAPTLWAASRRVRAEPILFGYAIRSISRRRARTSQLEPVAEKPLLADDRTTLGQSPDSRTVFERLEQLLPSTLQRPLGSPSDIQPGIEIIREELPVLLRDFRKVSQPGALSYLAAQDDRLEALVFLARQLSTPDVNDGSFGTDQPDRLSNQSPWLHVQSNSMSLDFVSEEPFILYPSDQRAPLMSRIQDVLDHEISEGQGSQSAHHEAIGELWSALGELIIRASSLNEDAAQILMQHAHLIFAHMHSEGLVPSDAYNFDDSTTPKAFRKPPYLHVLGSRMMAAMSDAAWNLQHSEQPTIPAADANLPPVVAERPVTTPHQLRQNVWLEFILWTCVRSGYYLEASRLLSAVCLADAEVRWSALTWDEVLALQTDAHKRQQSWFDRLMTVDEGYNAERPLIEMPTKSLSCEVLVAVLRGLLTLGDTEEIRAARKALFYCYCQSIEDRDATQTLMMNSIFQRLEGSSDLEPQVVSQLLFQQNQSAVDRDTQISNSFGLTADSTSLSTAFADLRSSLHVSYVLTRWESMIRHNDITEALELFESIRNIPGLFTRPKAPANEARNWRGILPQDTTYGVRMTSESLLRSETLPPQVPDVVLSSFLQLLIRTNKLEDAKVLLYDDAFRLRDKVANTTFHAALLQAGIALGDKELVSQMVHTFDVAFESLPDDVLYALFESQVWLGIYKDSLKLLKHMQQHRQLSLKPWLVVATACKFIATARSKFTQNSTEVRKVLIRMLNGSFLPLRNPSQPKDYTEIRTLTQLVRILLSAHPSIETLGLPEEVYYETSQRNTPIAISADAFNPLLETVVELMGADTGRKLFDTWCQPSPSPEIEGKDDGMAVVVAPFEDEKVVTPTIETIRIVLRSSLEDLRAWDQGGSRRRDPQRRLLKWMEPETKVVNKDLPVVTELASNVPHRELLEWGAQKLRQMGLDDYAINGIIPGTFPNAK